MVSGVSARDSEWKDKKFDCTKLRTILVFEPVMTPTVQDTFAPQKVADAVEEKLIMNNPKLKFITFAQLLDTIKSEAGVDPIALQTTDKAKFNELLSANIPKYCDAILGTEILAMGYSTTYVEGYSFPVTTNQTSYFNGSVNGSTLSGTVSSPNTQYYHVPGRNYEVVNVGVRVTLYNPLMAQPIWAYSDVRDRVNKPLNRTTTERMLQRIIGRIAEKINSLPYVKY